MTDLDRYLTTTHLFDCSGGISHALTLMPDGRVRIRTDRATVVWNPSSGETEPSGIELPEFVRHAAAELRA